MEFGVAGPAWKMSPDDLRALDRSNFSALYLQDHPGTDQPDVWSMLTYIAAHTQRLYLGTHVSAAPFYHPTKLAKQVVAVDVVSNGRARLGIGGGWTIADFEPFGYPYPSMEERLDLLEETIQALKCLWTEDKANFAGRIFQLKGGNLQPKPVQKPHPPIIIGANTNGRILRMSAALADEFNTWALGPAHVKEKRERLDECCRAIGRDPASLRLSADVMFVRGGTEEAARQNAERVKAWSTPAGRPAKATKYYDATNTLYGDADAMTEQVQRFVDIGVCELTVWMQKLEDMLWFSEEIIPKFRRIDR